MQKQTLNIILISIAVIAITGSFFLKNIGAPIGYERLHDLAIISIAMISYGFLLYQYRSKAIIFIVVLGLLSWGLEWVGITYCFPYGCFEYKNVLGIKLAGVVPLAIFFGWGPLVLGCYALARSLAQKGWQIVFLGVLLLLATDFILDPGAVAINMRAYQEGGWYYGVPWSNFAGWVFSGSIAMSISQVLFHTVDLKKNQLLQYMYSWFFMVLFWGGFALWSGMWIPVMISLCLTKKTLSKYMSIQKQITQAK